jgi:redox-sensitive bicupin YhaK (pirin superfamily)
MITLRKAGDRGHADHGWLRSRHSFSFADYRDPAQMGFGNLRVLNDDTVAPGTGFGAHGHRDMEIVSYVLDGALAHADSLGNGGADGASGVTRPGDVQRMTAGTGVRHSEFNHSQTEATHFLQIWLLPERLGLEPGYEQVHVPAAAKRGRLALVGAPEAAPGAVRLQADARIFAGLFDGDERQALPLPAGRLAYVHLARGALRVNGRTLEAGDALKLQGEAELVLEDGRGAEVLVFDLAP